MKIALPSKGNNVDGHFGHCEYFTIFTIDDKKKIISEEQLVPGVECGCKSSLVPQLSEKGVSVMLAGNMGTGAVNKLNNHGIEVIRGCSGNVKDVALLWLNESLKDSGENCSSHEHQCNNH